MTQRTVSSLRATTAGKHCLRMYNDHRFSHYDYNKKMVPKSSSKLTPEMINRIGGEVNMKRLERSGFSTNRIVTLNHGFEKLQSGRNKNVVLLGLIMATPVGCIGAVAFINYFSVLLNIRDQSDAGKIDIATKLKSAKTDENVILELMMLPPSKKKPDKELMSADTNSSINLKS